MSPTSGACGSEFVVSSFESDSFRILKCSEKRSEAKGKRCEKSKALHSVVLLMMLPQGHGDNIVFATTACYMSLLHVHANLPHFGSHGRRSPLGPSEISRVLGETPP